MTDSTFDGKVKWLGWNMDFHGFARMGPVAKAEPEVFFAAAMQRTDLMSEAIRYLDGENLHAGVQYILNSGTFHQILHAAKTRPDKAEYIQERLVFAVYRRVHPGPYELKSWIREVKGIDTSPVQSLFAEQAHLVDLVDFQCEKDSPANVDVTVSILIEKGEGNFLARLCRHHPGAAAAASSALEKAIQDGKPVSGAWVASWVALVGNVPGVDFDAIESALIAKYPKSVRSYVRESKRTQGMAFNLVEMEKVLEE